MVMPQRHCKARIHLTSHLLLTLTRVLFRRLERLLVLGERRSFSRPSSVLAKIHKIA